MPNTFHSEKRKALAKALAEQRRARGMTQAQLATALRRHQPFIANIESGERRVDVIELIELCDLLDIDVHRLIENLRK